MTYQTFYQNINKPFFAPEPWVFGLAWGIIYPLIALALGYMLYLLKKGRLPKTILVVFLMNLIANALYTPIQLYASPLIGATLDIYIILGTLAYVEWKIWKYSKIIFLLLLPYLLWGTFATALQTSILFLN